MPMQFQTNSAKRWGFSLILSLIVAFLGFLSLSRFALGYNMINLCPDGQIYDTGTQTCVEDPAMKTEPIQCPEGQIYNPDTRECIDDPGTMKEPVCPDGQIYSETDQVCVEDKTSTDTTSTDTTATTDTGTTAEETAMQSDDPCQRDDSGNYPADCLPDVPKDHWSRDALETAYSLDIVSGNADGTFKPGNELTRYEYAQILFNLFGQAEAETVDAGDYATWRSNYGATPKGSSGSSGVVDAADYLVWRDNLGSSNTKLLLFYDKGNHVGNASATEEIEVVKEVDKSSATMGAAFPDVPADHWASNATRWARESGCMTGYDDGRFGGNDPLRRSEAIAAFARCLGVDLSAYDGNTSFPDVSGDAWFASAMAWAKDSGVIAGYDDGTSRPTNTMVRAEATQFMVNGLTKDFDPSGGGRFWVFFGATEPLGDGHRDEIELLSWSWGQIQSGDSFFDIWVEVPLE